MPSYRHKLGGMPRADFAKELDRGFRWTGRVLLRE